MNTTAKELAAIILGPNDTPPPGEADDSHIDPVYAAERVLNSFVIIPRTDLPAFKIIDRKGEPHVDCGSDWGTWNVKHVERMRETALEYVGAWLTAEQWHAEQEEARMTRRDELARQYTLSDSYAASDLSSRALIERIIELEQAAA